MFALVDCNSFYASCERLFRPDLIHTPIAVLSNNDGCVIAMCDRAKSLGIKMGEPLFKMRELAKSKGVQVFSSNYTLYGDISRRVMSLLEQMAPRIEVYSIDEAFLDLSGMDHFDLGDLGERIRAKVLNDVGIPTCVGIAPTKALAKSANRVAKKFKEKTGGVWVLDSDEKIEKCLRWLKVEDVWGIGRRYAERFKAMGVKTAWDFTRLEESLVRSFMTVVGVRLQKELKGLSCLPLEEIVNPKQSICTSRSFGKNLDELEPVEKAVAWYASRCAKKLRRQGLCCRVIRVFIHTNPFNETEPHRSVHAQRTFSVPTSYDVEIVATALAMLRDLWQDGYRYKKAGVIVMDNVPESEVQGSLFDEVDRDKAKATMNALDRINSKYRGELLHLGTVEHDGDWKLRRELLSPCYTTNWNQLITVRI